jgi:hypothetical protein
MFPCSAGLKRTRGRKRLFIFQIQNQELSVKLFRTIGFVFTTILLTQISLSQSQAHSVFKKIMDQKYAEMKINCNACHVEGEDKTERNLFGKLFYREMESENLTQTWKEKKGKEKRDYEQEVMTPVFEKALAKVAGMTYDEMVKSGLMEGIEKKDQSSASRPFLPNPFFFISLNGTSAAGNEPALAVEGKQGAVFRRIDSMLRKRLSLANRSSELVPQKPE